MKSSNLQQPTRTCELLKFDLLKFPSPQAKMLKCPSYKAQLGNQMPLPPYPQSNAFTPMPE